LKEFDLIYHKFSQDIHHYFYYLYGDKEIAAELTQETFYHVFSSLHRFRETCSLKTWVFSIAKHVHYQQLHRKKKQEVIAEYEQVENFSSQSDTKLMVQAALIKLREPYKQVLIFRSINDLSFQQIGYLMEKTENWAKVTYHRGKMMLRDLLEEDIV
jgi:RNA polymerase sigma factor, sigma-70 family